MFNLCNEIISLIYEFDPTKRLHFNKVIKELRKIHYITKIPISEEKYESIVQLNCRFHKITGKRKRLPFDKYDLVHKKYYIFMTDPFLEALVSV